MPATIQCSGNFNARLAIRSNASMTITSTAALMPKKIAWITGHKQQTGCQSAFQAVEPPAHIGRELHRDKGVAVEFVVRRRMLHLAHVDVPLLVQPRASVHIFLWPPVR